MEGQMEGQMERLTVWWRDEIPRQPRVDTERLRNSPLVKGAAA
jgi:hypothetical protein